MHLVAVRGDEVADGSDSGADDEVILLHEAGTELVDDALTTVATAMAADVDVVTASWTAHSEEHGVIRRRAVLSPERVRWTNSVGPALAVRRSALERSGWGSDGHRSLSDAVLRLAELLDAGDLRIVSVPDVIADDRSGTDPTTAANLHAAAVERHLERVGIVADVEPLPAAGDSAAVRVTRTPAQLPTIAIVVPTTGRLTEVHGAPERLVVRLLSSIGRRTAVPPDRVEIVLVVGPEADPELRPIVERLADDELDGITVRFIETAVEFSHSHRTNLGVLATDAEVIVALNDDTEVVSPDWLTQIVAVACEPGVGLVGPVLRYPDGTLQSAGHAHPCANISEPYAPVAASQEPLMRLGRDVVGVTLACAALRRDHFDAVGGLSSRIHNAFNDVDLSMKLTRQGLRHVSLGHVEMTHLHTVTRAPGVQGFEERVLLDRWGSAMLVEPWHHTDEAVAG